jgi:hypothetical protein
MPVRSIRSFYTSGLVFGEAIDQVRLEPEEESGHFRSVRSPGLIPAAS